MGRCKHNLRKWKYPDEDDTTCDCKEADQTMEHLFECPRQTCSLDDLMVYNDVRKRMCQTMDRIGVPTRQEEEDHIINDSQYGFRKAHSTVYTATELIDRLTYKLDNNQIPFNIYIDLSKTCDTLNHIILSF